MATRHRCSKHFTIEEFDCHDGTACPTRLYQGYDDLCEWVLEPLRDRFGPVHVISGFRTGSHNRQVGGKIHSVHLGATVLPGRPAGSHTMAAAADVACHTSGPINWALFARSHRMTDLRMLEHERGGVGLYIAQGFVHVDTGPRRDWSG